MRIIVQKFGGTSVSSESSRQDVLRHIIRERTNGRKTVVVVSAMGRHGDPYATDTLLELIQQSGNALPERDKDLLLSCGEIISATVMTSSLIAAGIPAVTLTGGQAGIQTTADFGSARIVHVDPAVLLQHLEEDKVVVVAGFQGRTKDGETTTLGRGGSDTTAAALGAALGAEVIDIFTDVDGILTADPRIVKGARQIPVVSYEEISNMAHNGAKVIHPRAVEIAMKAGVPIRVRSTFSDSEGTWVTFSEEARKRPGWTDRTVTGLAHFRGLTQFSVPSDPDGNAYDVQLRVFSAMAKNGISVDLINVLPSGIHYTVKDADADKALRLLRDLGYEPAIRTRCAKLSIIGGGMNDEPGVMARIVEALTARQITILQSADSNTTIWILVADDEMVEALDALHTAFGLHLAIH